MDLLVAVTLLVSVTTVDGARVYINPQFVVRIYPTKEAQAAGSNSLVVKGAKCVITMNDGKFISVLEDCDYVLKKLEGKVKQ